MSTQVNERQLLNPTPEPIVARPSREDSPDMDIEHKAVDARPMMSSHMSSHMMSSSDGSDVKEKQAEQISELKSQLDRLMDEVADVMVRVFKLS